MTVPMAITRIQCRPRLRPSHAQNLCTYPPLTQQADHQPRGSPATRSRPKWLRHLEPQRRAPMVAIRDLVHRSPGRHPPLPGGVAEGHARREQPAVLLRYTEDLEHLVD